MKEAIKVIIFHFICIIIFAFLYYIFKGSFNPENSSDSTNSIKYENFTDFLLLSTTIQASVGISGIYPINDIGKTLMIIQQMIMMSTHVFMIYFFTV
jgi:hypothetical protein